MAEVPTITVGMVARRDKNEPPYPATIYGMTHIPGLEVGGGPILPEPPDIDLPPEWGIWPNPPEGIAPHPEHPIVLPDPILPPDQPPAVIPTPHLGWNWYDNPDPRGQDGWYYVYAPGAGDPQPKAA